MTQYYCTAVEFKYILNTIFRRDTNITNWLSLNKTDKNNWLPFTWDMAK